MKPPSLPLLLLLLHLIATISAAPSLSPTPAPTTSPISPSPIPPHKKPSSSSSPLDPKQLKALESLNIPTVKDPCNHRPASKSTPSSVVTCDTSSQFRLVTSISFANCSSDLSISSPALRGLSPSLTSLSFLNYPSLSPPRLPDSLHSFSAVSSFRSRRNGLSGVYLARLVNLTDLTVSSVPVSTSGLFVILRNMRKIVSLTISHAYLSGNIPRSLVPISHSSIYQTIYSKAQYPLQLLYSPT